MSFEGPKVKFNSPKINFGLIKAGITKEIDIEIENLTDIPAPLLFRNSKNKNLTIEKSIK